MLFATISDRLARIGRCPDPLQGLTDGHREEVSPQPKSVSRLLSPELEGWRERRKNPVSPDRDGAHNDREQRDMT
jgi:hypothetical protein